VNALATRGAADVSDRAPPRRALVALAAAALVVSAVGAGVGASVAAGAPADQTPYDGAATLPGRVQAENFDEGGEGVAYADADPANRGGDYRSGGVDVGETNVSGEYAVGWTADGEWLEYTVDAEAGTYDLAVRVASPNDGRAARVLVDGEAVATVDVPNTGGWNAWTTVEASGVNLSEGDHVVRVEMVGGGINLDWFAFRAASPPAAEQEPYGGTYGGGVPTPPRRIEAEDFDEGGEGVAYHDADAGNAGGAYRDTGVDVAASTDVGGGYAVTDAEAGEWLEYTVAPEPGRYGLDLRVRPGNETATLRVLVAGAERGTVTVPGSDGDRSWETVTLTDLALDGGERVVRVEVANGSVALNWLLFDVVDGSTAQGPFSGRLTGLPGRVEAERFDVGGPGVAYEDVHPVNTDGAYRTAGVYLTAVDGGYAVAYTEDGEWLEYSTNARRGTYDLEFRVAKRERPAALRVSVDGEERGTVTVPETGGYDSWETVTLENVSLAEGSHVVRVEMVGGRIRFDRFEARRSAADGADDGPTDDGPTATVGLAAPDAAVPVGETATVNVTVSGADAGVGSYAFAVETTAPGLEVVDATPLGEPRATNVSVASDGSGVRVSAAGVRDAARSTLARVTVRASGAGEATLRLSDVGVGDADGSADYDVAAVRNATLRGVASEPEPDPDPDPTLPGAAGPATDVDGDGLLEDANGNGAFTLADVTFLFARYGAGAVQPHPDAFDYNRNGEVTLADLTALFRERVG
jgi:hypothetical protein